MINKNLFLNACKMMIVSLSIPRDLVWGINKD